MPTQAEVLGWLVQNWPSVVMAAIFSAVYLRLSRFVARQTRLEKRVQVIREICSQQHKDNAQRIWQEDDKE